MKISEKILNLIKNHYGENHYYNYSDMINHLRSNRIDNFESLAFKHNGFDSSYDNSVTIFHYEDNSLFIVTTTGFIATMKL